MVQPMLLFSDMNNNKIKVPAMLCIQSSVLGRYDYVEPLTSFLSLSSFWKTLQKEKIMVNPNLIAYYRLVGNYRGIISILPVHNLLLLSFYQAAKRLCQDVLMLVGISYSIAAYF